MSAQPTSPNQWDADKELDFSQPIDPFRPLLDDDITERQALFSETVAR